jgi:hypothetical protein
MTIDSSAIGDCRELSSTEAAGRFKACNLMVQLSKIEQIACNP